MEQSQLKHDFRHRVVSWAKKLHVDARSIYIRPMSRKWASCSTAGTLSFNEELLSLPTELMDYVIVHELLHFSVPNHGKLWKALMRAHLGDWESKAELLNSDRNAPRRASLAQPRWPRTWSAPPSLVSPGFHD